jgi:hypothetical protein
MAKDGPKPTSQNSSAFQKFERLTKRLIGVPKGTMDKTKQRDKQKRR